MKKSVFVIIIVGALLAPAFAQEKTADVKPSEPAAAPTGDAAPQVSTQDKQTLNDLQLRAFGYAQSIATLQKELDSVNAEFGRTVQRLQSAQPGYELSQALTYVKKPEPKKDEAKSTSPPK